MNRMHRLWMASIVFFLCEVVSEAQNPTPPAEFNFMAGQSVYVMAVKTSHQFFDLPIADKWKRNYISAVCGSTDNLLVMGSF